VERPASFIGGNHRKQKSLSNHPPCLELYPTVPTPDVKLKEKQKEEEIIGNVAREFPRYYRRPALTFSYRRILVGHNLMPDLGGNVQCAPLTHE